MIFVADYKNHRCDPVEELWKFRAREASIDFGTCETTDSDLKCFNKAEFVVKGRYVNQHLCCKSCGDRWKKYPDVTLIPLRGEPTQMIEFFAKMQPGDELWWWSSPEESWLTLRGACGYSIRRGGETVDSFTVAVN